MNQDINWDAATEQRDDLNPENPQIDPEPTAIASDFRGQPIYSDESYFTLDQENYKIFDALMFLSHYIHVCGAEQVLEQLGAKECNTEFNPEKR